MTAPASHNGNGNGNGKALAWLRQNVALIGVLIAAGITIGRNWNQVDVLQVQLNRVEEQVVELRRDLDSKAGGATASEAGRALQASIERVQMQADRNYRLIMEIQDQLRVRGRP